MVTKGTSGDNEGFDSSGRCWTLPGTTAKIWPKMGLPLAASYHDRNGTGMARATQGYRARPACRVNLVGMVGHRHTRWKRDYLMTHGVLTALRIRHDLG